MSRIPAFVWLTCAAGALVHSGDAAAASLFYSIASVCLSSQPCDTTSQTTVVGGAPADASISRSYTYVPEGGAPGGYSFGDNGHSVFEAPNRWHGYAQAGGFASIGEPYALNHLSASASAGASMFDSLTIPSIPGVWTGPGTLRFSWRVHGNASVSYSAPGTPDLANATVTLGVSCARLLGAGSAPCSSPDFDPAPPGSNTLFGSRQFNSSQTFDEIIDFDLSVYSDTTFSLLLTLGVGAGLGYSYGTPPGALNGLAYGDFLNTGELVGVVLYDAFGRIVENPIIVSDSGFDYANVAAAVPLPGAGWLLLSALPLAARRRRRHTAAGASA